MEGNLTPPRFAGRVVVGRSSVEDNPKPPTQCTSVNYRSPETGKRYLDFLTFDGLEQVTNSPTVSPTPELPVGHLDVSRAQERKVQENQSTYPPPRLDGSRGGHRPVSKLPTVSDARVFWGGRLTATLSPPQSPPRTPRRRNFRSLRERSISPMKVTRATLSPRHATRSRRRRRDEARLRDVWSGAKTCSLSPNCTPRVRCHSNPQRNPPSLLATVSPTEKGEAWGKSSPEQIGGCVVDSSDNLEKPIGESEQVRPANDNERERGHACCAGDVGETGGRGEQHLQDLQVTEGKALGDSWQGFVQALRGVVSKMGTCCPSGEQDGRGQELGCVDNNEEH